jgi:hypothetical protein
MTSSKIIILHQILPSSSSAKEAFSNIDFRRRFFKTSMFLANRPFGFHIFGFGNNNFFTQKVVSLTSKPKPGGQGPCVYVPQ